MATLTVACILRIKQSPLKQSEICGLGLTRALWGNVTFYSDMMCNLDRSNVCEFLKDMRYLAALSFSCFDAR